MITIDILPSVPEDQPPVLPRYAFVINAYVVFGDGDGSATAPLKMIPKMDGYEVEVEEAVRLLETMLVTYLDNDTQDYSNVEGFNKWFDNGNTWPMDPYCDYEFPGRIDGYDIVYYDANNVIHPVEISLGK